MKKHYLLLGFLLTLLPFQMLLAQSRSINGTVSDANKEGLIGVTVSLKGTTVGTVTDENGAYSITVGSGNDILVFSYVGFISQEITAGTQTQVNVTLAEDVQNLSEVVVVGYGTQKKSQLAGAISSVSAEDIMSLPITNARQALQGRAAGVDVVQAGSKPGAGPQIRIRGRRSFNATNNPLYVVDGIPLSGGIDDINPQDILSMEILKDASATAIYGARGANGVVIISTRRGTSGKTIVSFDTYVGVNQSMGNIKVFDGPGYAEYKRESRRAIGQYPLGKGTEADDAKIFEPIEMESIKLGRSTDYVNGMLQDGMIQSHQLGVSGGSEKTNFNITGNFFQDIGVVKKQDFTRYTFRVNLDHQINKSLKIGLSTLFVSSARNGENFNPLGGALAENPLGKPYDDAGNLIFLPTLDGLRTNPFAEIVEGAQVDLGKRYRIFNSIYGEWQIAKGLKYRVNFGPDFTVTRNGRFTGAFTQSQRGGVATGSAEDRFNFNFTLENIVTYDKKFGSSHNFNFTALQSFQKDREEYSGMSVSGIPAEAQLYHSLGSASLITGAATSLSEWALLSYMGRINYDFREKYLLTATVRADGSSRFGTNNRFGIFPSVAVGWNIARESFMEDLGFLETLKLRASYGAIGNQAINPYQTQALLGRTAYAYDNTAGYGYRPSTIGNPDLRWETSTTANIGLDFSFFSGRINGSAEYYNTTTTDLLAPQPLPTSTGFGGFITNVGSTQNKGVELTLSTVNVDKGGFTWETDLIFNKNTEAILELANGKVDDIAAGRFIGKPLTVFFDYKKLGIWQTNEAEQAKVFGDKVGQIKVEDFNGDGRINASDRQILGSAVPDFATGITNRFSYKGIDFSFFIFARIGQMIRSRYHLDQNKLAGRYNNIAVDYWTPSNPTNAFPQPVVTQEFPKYDNSLAYFDGSFIKVRNINIGYNLPKAVVAKLKMESLRFFSSIQQPFIISQYITKYQGVDPETWADGEQGVGGGEVSGSVSPAIRTITIGLNAKF